MLLKRTLSRGGFWQAITGGLEEGETKAEALKREVKEETRITSIIEIIEDVYYREFLDSGLVKEYVFGMEVSSDEKIVIDGNEHTDFKCSLPEASRLMKWKSNREALKRLNGILNS